MGEDELAFAVIADDIITCMNHGFTRRDYIATTINSKVLKAMNDWNAVTARLTGNPEPEAIIEISSERTND